MGQPTDCILQRTNKNQHAIASSIYKPAQPFEVNRRIRLIHLLKLFPFLLNYNLFFGKRGLFDSNKLWIKSRSLRIGMLSFRNREVSSFCERIVYDGITSKPCYKEPIPVITNIIHGRVSIVSNGDRAIIHLISIRPNLKISTIPARRFRLKKKKWRATANLWAGALRDQRNFFNFMRQLSIKHKKIMSLLMRTGQHANGGLPATCRAINYANYASFKLTNNEIAYATEDNFKSVESLNLEFAWECSLVTFNIYFYRLNRRLRKSFKGTAQIRSRHKHLNSLVVNGTTARLTWNIIKSVELRTLNERVRYLLWKMYKFPTKNEVVEIKDMQALTIITKLTKKHK